MGGLWGPIFGIIGFYGELRHYGVLHMGLEGSMGGLWGSVSGIIGFYGGIMGLWGPIFGIMGFYWG